ncbi:MAG TPA: hypothetical protein VIX73_36445, partial [Kofleriaceae bacterium]
MRGAPVARIGVLAWGVVCAAIPACATSTPLRPVPLDDASGCLPAPRAAMWTMPLAMPISGTVTFVPD